MPTFYYTGKNLAGEARKGEVEAVTIAQATATLKRMQINPSTLSERKAGSFFDKLKGFKLGGGVTARDLVIFSRQFATMIDAGLPLVQCLDILGSQQENAEFKRVLMEVKSSVEGGSTFADSLRKHPKVFDELYVNLIAAGEVGGILDTILNRLSGFLEKAEKLKGKIKSAMTYPTAVIGIATIIVAGLLIFVVPIFEGMFSSFGKALPAPTQMVVNMSNALKHQWYIIIAVIVGIFVSVKVIHSKPKGKRAIDALLLKIPVVGDLIRKSAVARFTRTLGTMLSSGVPILEALEIVAKTASNTIILEAILKARLSLSQGKTLAEPLMETKVFPGMVTQMISVGESTGALDAMLNKIADFYEEEVDVAVDSLTSLIEPALMAFLGVVVGGLVIALYLPIFSLAGAAGG
ncbi:MAG: type II secretion system F family protein [Deltaproteobacteria bacterium]|nr:type II secretion system F family protein [Deltaproteobacteria bacterium]